MHLWIQCMLIRVSRDQRSFDSFPGLFAVFHALHRLLAPRHPPHALSSLAALIPSSVRVSTHSGQDPRQLLAHQFSRTVGKVTILFSRARAEISKKLPVVCRSAPRFISVRMQLLPLPNCQRTTVRSTRGAPERPTT